MRNLIIWPIVALSRILVWLVWGLRVPFAIIGKACDGINDFLREVQTDIRNACPWPWLDEFRAKFAVSNLAEQERLLRGLRQAK